MSIESLAKAIAERHADEFWSSAAVAKIVAENGATGRQYWRWENLPESNREEYRRIATLARSEARASAFAEAREAAAKVAEDAAKHWDEIGANEDGPEWEIAVDKANVAKRIVAAIRNLEDHGEKA